MSFQVSGKSTFGAPISESYALRGHQAQWRSVADHGEATVTAPAVYVPVDSSFEAFAVIVRAALRQRENRIAALPGGELTVRKVLDSTLQSTGHSAAVALYAIIGIDTQPDFLWLTAGSNPRFFALVIPGYLRVIEQGWEAQSAELERLQVQAEHDWLHSTRRAPRPVPPRSSKAAGGCSCRRCLTCTRMRTPGISCCRLRAG